MSLSAEGLWAQLIAVLRHQGRLPLGYERMTPAEFARRLGDPRIGPLVWDWYYPRRYGDQPGRMSDADAQALIVALGGGGEATRSAEAAQHVRPEVIVNTCRLCGDELPTTPGEVG